MLLEPASHLLCLLCRLILDYVFSAYQGFESCGQSDLPFPLVCLLVELQFEVYDIDSQRANLKAVQKVETKQSFMQFALAEQDFIGRCTTTLADIVKAGKMTMRLVTGPEVNQGTEPLTLLIHALTRI